MIFSMSHLAADSGFSAARDVFKCVPVSKRPSGMAIANSPELMIGSLRVVSLFFGLRGIKPDIVDLPRIALLGCWDR